MNEGFTAQTLDEKGNLSSSQHNGSWREKREETAFHLIAVNWRVRGCEGLFIGVAVGV